MISEKRSGKPFRAMRAGNDEGVLSKIRSGFVCKEYLAERVEKPGLDRFILYGSGIGKTQEKKERPIWC